MRFYHFTAPEYLRAIDTHGLTVGDVPINLFPPRGRVGVWLTTSDRPEGHGLAGSVLSKRSYRLTVELSEDAPSLVRWLDWAPNNVEPKTLANLHSSHPLDGDRRPETWFIHFRPIPRSAIVACTNMHSGRIVEDWPNAWPPELDRPGVPAWRRDTWHKRLMSEARRYNRRMEQAGVKLVATIEEAA